MKIVRATCTSEPANKMWRGGLFPNSQEEGRLHTQFTHHRSYKTLHTSIPLSVHTTLRAVSRLAHIIWAIFLLVAAETYHYAAPRIFGVCRQWRQTSLASPRMWSSINISRPMLLQIAKSVQTRSSTNFVPQTISLHRSAPTRRRGRYGRSRPCGTARPLLTHK